MVPLEDATLLSVQYTHYIYHIRGECQRFEHSDVFAMLLTMICEFDLQQAMGTGQSIATDCIL